jgi:acyl carrier protein
MLQCLEMGQLGAAIDPGLTAAAPVWTERRIELLIVRLLADLLHEEPDKLQDSLLAKGEDMPIDSLDLFDVLAEFRQQTGITLPKRRLGREVMRSVKAFSKVAAEKAK